MRVIALDPGITTGLSVASVEDETVELTCEQALFDHWHLYELLAELRPEHIVCESFEYRNRSRAGLVLFSVELIGIVKFYQQATAHAVELYFPTAAKGKSHDYNFFNDDKLKKMGLYVKGKEHGRDAVRHFMNWFTFGAGYQFNAGQSVRLLATQQ